jgi:hypothetical protein
MTDGGYEAACPPLRAVLDIMAYGEHEGKTIDAPEIRQLFTRDSLLQSDWYKQRLSEKMYRDIDHWQGFEARLVHFLADETEKDVARELNLQARLAHVQKQLKIVQGTDYEASLVGTLGADPMRPSPNDKLMIDRLANA